MNMCKYLLTILAQWRCAILSLRNETSLLDITGNRVKTDNVNLQKLGAELDRCRILQVPSLLSQSVSNLTGAEFS